MAELDHAHRLRMINLVEVLDEEAQSKGMNLEHPEDLLDRDEEQIRAFFAAPQIMPMTDVSSLVNTELFRRWFPGYPVTQSSSRSPRWRVLCFANAGNAEDMYTSEGTGKRRTPSPLLEWCRANDAECLAVQLPGRSMRRLEDPMKSCQEVAGALVPLITPLLQDKPYFVIAHSVGCWNAFEFLQLARDRGLRMPGKIFFSAMAAPDIAGKERPWREQHLLPENEFKEECRGWDVNELVFSEAMWGTYQPLMRADFRLFDQYHYQHKDKQPFNFPITAFYGSEDRRISKDMVKGWQKFTTAEFVLQEINGNHLWPLAAAPKTTWLHAIVDGIQ